MLIVVAALLFQLPIFSSSNIQAAEKARDMSTVARVSEAPAVSGKSDSSASSEKREVLSAAKLPADTEASVAFAPGRLVPPPVPPLYSSPAPPSAHPPPP